MTALAQYPSNIRLTESLAFSLQFTAPANMADPATCRFDMLFQSVAGPGTPAMGLPITRTSATLLGLAAAVGISQAQLDAIFTAAAAVTL